MGYFNKENEMSRRYELKTGKFGCYFHDTQKQGTNLSLGTVLEILNRKEDYKKRLTAFNQSRPRHKAI